MLNTKNPTISLKLFMTAFVVSLDDVSGAFVPGDASPFYFDGAALREVARLSFAGYWLGSSESESLSPRLRRLGALASVVRCFLAEFVKVTSAWRLSLVAGVVCEAVTFS